ncbi:hypothetical protein HC752_12875 [Vibrio sp. S9_S30]|uniref:hypothetical protein n=1 Tax=Vibrio sp. S9_S30 TaxID=2720226 RepID=UPI00168035F0|nr:hypothetical protein [Vibrio sp. S9_S30]MBD1557827.1 hypothetical protein [Vibrio sp. S9_S30]
MKALNLSKLSLAAAFALCSTAAFAQSPDYLDIVEGRTLSYLNSSDSQSPKMLITFAEQSHAGSIAFNLDHTCGYVTGTLKAINPGSLDSDAKITLNKFGGTRQCTAEEFEDLRTLVSADKISNFRLAYFHMEVSSKVTGAKILFTDITDDIKPQRARQAVLDSYWVRNDATSDSQSDEKPSVAPYLERVQTDHPFLVVHNNALRIFETDRTDTGIAAETLVGSISIKNRLAPLSGNKGTTLTFDRKYINDHYSNGINFTEGSIEFDDFYWLQKIFLTWPGELRAKNRFQVNGDSLILSSDTSDESFTFNRLVKLANIEDLKNTEWVGSIANENVTVRYSSHSLKEMILAVEGRSSRVFVKLNTNKSDSFSKAEVVSSLGRYSLATTLSNAFPDLKSIVVDYSDANNRKLHIVTQSEIFSLTEKRASTPITFN